MSFSCTDTHHDLHIQSKAKAESISRDTQNIGLYRADIIRGVARKIPSPSVFHFEKPLPASPGSSSKAQLPCAAELATHLELLETFHALRQRVLVSEEIDDAFNIRPNRTVKKNGRGDTKTLKDDTLVERRQIKWPKFVEFAVVRFLDWKDNLRPRAKGAILDQLPPLDVLMVWHALLLNPLLFYQYFKDESLYWIRMPWDAVHSAIDNLDWNYELGVREKLHYEGQSRTPADLFQQLNTWHAKSKLSNAKTLRRPTYYAFNCEDGPDPATHDLAPSEYSVITDRDRVAGMHSSLTPEQRTTAAEQHDVAARYAYLFRKYDQESESLALQLRDAVLRQCDSVDKMNKHLWIRSPALAGTLRRATDRYEKFLNLIRMRPKLMVVPTLDIDLVWHTHQCTAGFYARDAREWTGRFVNHNDKLGKGILDDGFSETRKFFKFHFVEEYDRCGCWECESLLDYVERAASSGAGRIKMDDIAAKVRRDITFHRQMEIATRTRAKIK